jgi:hypothetical protein
MPSFIAPLLQRLMELKAMESERTRGERERKERRRREKEEAKLKEQCAPCSARLLLC